MESVPRWWWSGLAGVVASHQDHSQALGLPGPRGVRTSCPTCRGIVPRRFIALWPSPECAGKERDRAAKLGPHSGLGTWAGARVAPLRCPILRPSEIGCTVSGGVQQHFMHFLTAVRRLAAPLGNPPHEAAGCALRTERAESQWANENSQLTGLDIQRATHNIQRSDILAV